MSGGEPSSYLTLQEGTEVRTSDGVRIGVVEHVLRDESVDIFDGIVIDARVGPGGLRFVDAPEVAEIFTDHVLLSITAAEAANLHEPSASPGVMEHHGVEDTEGRIEHKLRRAWEMISGKDADR